MPERMLWTERLFSALGARSLSLKTQILFRFVFLLVLWFIGAVVYASDGLLAPYITSPIIYGGYYLPGLIILSGSFWTQNSLMRIIPSLRSILDTDENGFKIFSDKVEDVIYSFIPCLVIALIMAYFLWGIPELLISILMGGLTPVLAWSIASSLFFILIFATGVWMLIAIWYLILNVSIQEFQTDLLERASEEFKPLMRLILYYALFYFLTISIAVVSPLSGKSISWVEVIFSPYLIYVALGAASVVFPIYSIHLALMKIKVAKLTELRRESGVLISRLGKPNWIGENKSDELLEIMVRLQVVQLKEKYVQYAPDWPVNIDFYGKLVGLIIMPSIVRIFIELFKNYLPI